MFLTGWWDKLPQFGRGTGDAGLRQVKLELHHGDDRLSYKIVSRRQRNRRKKRISSERLPPLVVFFLAC